jgi:alpha-N-arabinofuranosidase
MLKPLTEYRFTAWIKTEDIIAEEGRGVAFILNGMECDTEYFTGTHDWRQIEYEFESGWDDSMEGRLAFGTGGRATGTVWLDHLALEVVSGGRPRPSVRADLEDLAEMPMEKYIYGQFIEHLGRCIYGGIWAEMLEDRKFYYSPADSMSPWVMTGDQTRIEMDRLSPYVGAHTPVIIPGKQAGGISQDQIGLREGVACQGRIILRSGQGMDQVVVKLYWDDDSYDSTVISGITPAYTAYDYTLTPGATTLAGRLEVTGSGEGSFAIGTLSLMPEDNVEGFRSDVLSLLRELNSPVYRWPGGNFVSGYDWKDGIGPVDKRPPRKNPAWRGVEHNDVGIHEFMKFCELLGTEPYIAVNAGLGGSEGAREQVEYVNGSADTPMGKLRTANGHPQPWKVRWWSVGNEMYGDWQLGFMPTGEFVRKHTEFVHAMKSADPSIEIVAVGNPGEWNEMMLGNAAGQMDYISEHFYRQDWHSGGLITHVRQIPDAIRNRAELHRQYRREIPGLAEKDIRICMDEWNYWYGPHVYGELGTRYFLRDALGIAAGIHEYSRQSDMIYMANYAQTVNVIGCIKTDDIHSCFATTGLVLKLYREHFGSIPVLLEESYRPLDVALALTPGQDTLCIGIVNPTKDSWKLPVRLGGASLEENGSSWTISGNDPMLYNEPGKEPVVWIEGPEQIRWRSGLDIQPLSIVLVRIPISNSGI